MASKPGIAKLKNQWKAKGLDWGYWIRGENDIRAALVGCYPDPTLGQHVVDFAAKYCRHFQGEWAGQPFIFAPWQVDDIVMPMFSWVRPDGTRRYNKASNWRPKKTGKSAECAVYGNYFLAADGEPGAEVYCGAVDKLQASIVFNNAANMVDASPGLGSRLVVIRSTKTITNGNSSWFRALSADVPSKEGLNAHAVIIDELHAHKNRDFFTTLMYAGRARRNFMLIIISTAGDDLESIGYEEYDYAKGVLGGAINDIRTFAYIREASVDDDWTDPKVWAKANPALGTIVSLERMQDDCNEAKQSPRKQADFKRYLLNIWVDSANPWLDMGHWDACGEPFAAESLDGNRCWGGLDLSSTTDLTAFVLAFPDESTGDVMLLAKFWLPDEGPWRDDARYVASYQEWIDKGYIELTTGRRVNYDYVTKAIVDASQRYEVRTIAFDPWNAHAVVTELAAQGIQMAEMRQGTATMNAPCKSFEAAVSQARIRHNRNPVLRWMASHTVVKSDESDNIRLHKKKSTSRIDGIVASVMAVSMADMEVGEEQECGVMLV